MDRIIINPATMGRAIRPTVEELAPEPSKGARLAWSVGRFVAIFLSAACFLNQVARWLPE
jgi:hypothetical protein